MNREILFRGKSIDSELPNEWYYGSLDYDGYIYRIKEHAKQANGFGGVLSIQVEPQTVGQFTGLYDKEGNRIFEGDIISFTFFTYIGVEKEEDMIGYICYGSLGLVFRTKEGGVYLAELNFDSESDIEVIDNIHDNPELLKEPEQ